MSISKLTQKISASPTLCLSEKAKILRSQGKPVINLGIGEPKNFAPQTAIDSVKDKLNDGLIKYGPVCGSPVLLEAICDYTDKNYDLSIDEKNIIVSKHSLFNSLLSIIDPGDEVILFAPYWVSYPELVKLVGGKAIVVNPDKETLLPDISEIKKAITSKTKAILLNSPSNPSGMAISGELIKKIVELCDVHDIYLITDDIYQKFIFEGKSLSSIFDFMKKDVDESKVIIINGVSKLYGMTGFRIGWAIANRELIKAMVKIQGQTTSCPSVISQVAAAGALNGDQSVVDELRAHIEDNKKKVVEELLKIPNLKFQKPDGTFYIFPDFSYYNQNSSELAEFILEKAMVVTIPGSAFGMEGHLRISFAGSQEEVIEGIKRIRWAIDPSSNTEIIIDGKIYIREW